MVEMLKRQGGIWFWSIGPIGGSFYVKKTTRRANNMERNTTLNHLMVAYRARIALIRSNLNARLGICYSRVSVCLTNLRLYCMRLLHMQPVTTYHNVPYTEDTTMTTWYECVYCGQDVTTCKCTYDNQKYLDCDYPALDNQEFLDDMRERDQRLLAMLEADLYEAGYLAPNYPVPAIPFECLLYDEFVAIWRKRDDAIHHECDVMIYKQY